MGMFVAVVVLSLLVAVVFGAAAWMGLSLYGAMRHSLYARPLTPQEQWSESSVEAGMSEEEWAAVLATEFPTQDTDSFTVVDRDIED